MTLCKWICFGSAMFCLAIGAEAQSLRGVVFVSHDETLVRRSIQLTDDQRTEEKFRGLYPPPRFETVRTKDRFLIVLDLESGLLAEVRDHALALKELSTSISTDGTVALAELRPEARAALARTLGVSATTLFANPSIRFGVNAQVAFTAQRGGRSATAQTPVAKQREQQARDRLRSQPAKEPTPEQSLKVQSSLGSRSERETRTLAFRLSYAGPDVREALAAGAVEAGQKLEALYREREDAGLALLGKFGASEALPLVEVPWDRLSPKAQAAALVGAEENWRVNGFGSPEEAKAFFRDARSVRAQTKFSIFLCVGGVEGTSIGVFSSHVFTTIRGGRAP